MEKNARASGDVLGFLSGGPLGAEFAAALVTPDRVWSYGELDACVTALARQLQAKGIGRGDVVGVLARRDATGVIGVSAVTRLGAAFLAVDPELPRARVAELLADSGAAAVLARQDDADRVTASLPQLVLPADPSLDHGENTGGGAREDGGFRDAPGASDPAYLVYTSGTTGRPKAVVATYGGVRHLASQQRETLALTPDSRIFQMASVTFDAYVFELVMALSSGAALVLPGPRETLPGPALAARLRAERVTHLVATPTALAAMPSDDLPDLRVVCSVGEPCTPSVREAWSGGPERRLLNLYGPAEAIIWATWSDLGYQPDPSCIGRPIAGVRALVLDSDLRPVPTGETGQLYLAGPTVALGYCGRPRLTAESFLPGPGGERIYATGDLVRTALDGSLYFIGRADRQIKIRGARVEPGEVEAAIQRIAGITQAAVTPLVDQASGRVVLGAVYAPQADSPEPRDVARELRRTLPRWMVPQRLLALPALPTTANGKTDARAVAALLTAEDQAVRDTAEASDQPDPPLNPGRYGPRWCASSLTSSACPGPSRMPTSSHSGASRCWPCS